MKTIDQANQEALRRILAGDPVLVDVVPASEAIPDLADRMILHAGPPIGWDRMCGPMRGAVMGIAVFEGWAKDLDDAATERRRRLLRVPPQSPLRRGRSDDRPDHQKPAADGGREQGLRQPRLLRDQRGPRQGDAVRRQRRRGARPPALDPRGPGAGARTRDARIRRHSAQAADRARAHHGRRDASAQRRLLEPAAAPARAVAGADIEERRRACRVPGLHRPQRSVLPQRRHGDGKGAGRPGARHRRHRRSSPR